LRLASITVSFVGLLRFFRPNGGLCCARWRASSEHSNKRQQSPKYIFVALFARVNTNPIVGLRCGLPPCSASRSVGILAIYLPFLLHFDAAQLALPTHEGDIAFSSFFDPVLLTLPSREGFCFSSGAITRCAFQLSVSRRRSSWYILAIE